MLSEINKIKEFDNHKFVTYINDDLVGLRGFIAIHRGNGKIPAFGATRIWNYRSTQDALIDALRLSRTMSYKAALAGLKCGGAKATLILGDREISNKKAFLRAYAKKINYLSGHFITGADVGVTRDDVIQMRRHSPYFVGIKADPVRFTGLGLLLSIKVCLREVLGKELNGNSFSIQGVGKIGQELLKLIYKHTDKIYIADIDEGVIRFVKKKYPKVNVVDSKVIHKQKVDIFSPCALSGCLSQTTVNELRCSIIVGGANNQLEDGNIAKNIHKKGILYAPDYVVNAGGLISVFDEYENKNYRVRRVLKRVDVIKENMERILSRSKRTKKTPLEIANNIAERYFNSLKLNG